MTFDPKMEILPEAQRALWPSLKPTQDMGLVLYGGTATALRLGHRPSVDFDFFTDRALDKDAIRKLIPFVEGGTVLREQADTFTVSVTPLVDRPPVALSFFGGLNMGRVGAPEVTSDGVLQVASIDDLMAQKVKVILQRVEAKDYQDIAAMLDNGASLERGLAAARTMFGPQFPPSESLRAMVYFEGGDLDRLTGLERATLIRSAGAVRELPMIHIIDRSLSGDGAFSLKEDPMPLSQSRAAPKAEPAGDKPRKETEREVPLPRSQESSEQLQREALATVDSFGRSLSPEAISQAIEGDVAVQTQRDSLSVRLRVVFASPAEAESKLMGIVGERGHAAAIEVLSTKPEQIGALRGSRGSPERETAISTAKGSVVNNIRSLETARMAAEKSYRTDVTAQLKFDADPVGTLSPKAQKAIDGITAARNNSERATAYKAMRADPDVAKEVDRFMDRAAATMKKTGLAKGVTQNVGSQAAKAVAKTADTVASAVGNAATIGVSLIPGLNVAAWAAKAANMVKVFRVVRIGQRAMHAAEGASRSFSQGGGQSL